MGYNFYNTSIKQSGATKLYTPANPYLYSIKKSGQGQAFNVEMEEISPGCYVSSIPTAGDNGSWFTDETVGYDVNYRYATIKHDITALTDAIVLASQNTEYGGGYYGSNLAPNYVFTKSGTVTIEFDYYHGFLSGSGYNAGPPEISTDWWYDDDLTDEQVYLYISNNDVTYSGSAWTYGMPISSNSLWIWMRKLTTAKVSIAMNRYTGVTHGNLSGLTSGQWGYNSYKIVIDWSTYTCNVYVNTVLAISNYDFSSIGGSFNSTYRIRFHIHHYGGTVNYRFLKNFKVC